MGRVPGHPHQRAGLARRPLALTLAGTRTLQLVPVLPGQWRAAGEVQRLPHCKIAAAVRGRGRGAGAACEPAGAAGIVSIGRLPLHVVVVVQAAVRQRAHHQALRAVG